MIPSLVRAFCEVTAREDDRAARPRLFWSTLGPDGWLVELARLRLRVVTDARLTHAAWAGWLGIADADAYRARLLVDDDGRAALVALARRALDPSIAGRGALATLMGCTIEYRRWSAAREIAARFEPRRRGRRPSVLAATGPLGRELEAHRLRANMSTAGWSAAIGVATNTYLRAVENEKPSGRVNRTNLATWLRAAPALVARLQVARGAADRARSAATEEEVARAAETLAATLRAAKETAAEANLVTYGDAGVSNLVDDALRAAARAVEDEELE